MAKMTVEDAAGKYRDAKKALTRRDPNPPPAERARLQGKLAGAEYALVKAVADLINKHVAIVEVK